MPAVLEPLAADLGRRLKALGHTVAVAESSTGGLISAALLAIPGASATIAADRLSTLWKHGANCSASAAPMWKACNR